jgi:hypothetical protein
MLFVPRGKNQCDNYFLSQKFSPAGGFPKQTAEPFGGSPYTRFQD